MNKKAQELAMHDKDTGSSEIQIALLTEKIETLSKHIKQVQERQTFISWIVESSKSKKKIVRLS